METEVHPDKPYAVGEAQSNLNSLGMWVFLSGEILFFGVLFTAYMIFRYKFPESFAEASQHLDLIMGSVNTVILLTSSLTMALAVNAAQRTKKKQLILFLILTLVLGSIFLGIKFSEYGVKISEGLLPTDAFQYEGEQPNQARIFFSLYFIMTGIHAIHMIIGIFLLGFLAVQALRNKYSFFHYAPVEITGLYWHFVDIVWIFLFPMLYLIERHG